MKNRYRPGPIVVERELIKSKAFLSLTGAAAQVLFIFLSKRQLRKIKGCGKRKDRWVIENNGQIQFSYREAKKKYEISEARFTRAIDQLISNGFIEIAKEGGGCYGIPTLYSIVDRWHLYGSREFEQKMRIRREYQVGFCRKGAKTTIENDGGTAIENDGG